MRFKDKQLKRFWRAGSLKGIGSETTEHLKDLLSALDAAKSPGDMNQPGWAFHPLKGNRAGEFAVEVAGAFRLVFEWENGEAVRVRVEDYHGG